MREDLLTSEQRGILQALISSGRCKGSAQQVYEILDNVTHRLASVLGPFPSPTPGAQASPKAEAQGAAQWAVVSVFPASRKPAKIISGYVFDKREDAENALWMDFAPEPGSKYSNYTVAPVGVNASPPDSIPVAEVEKLIAKYHAQCKTLATGEPDFSDGIASGKQECAHDLLALVARHRKGE